MSLPELNLQSRLETGAPHNHAVQFYDDDAYVASTVADYIAEGLVHGDAAIVIATPSHRRAITAGLTRRGVEWKKARASKTLVLLDAGDTLAAFAAGSSIDAGRFDLVVGGQVRKAIEASATRRVRAYGEMVDLLWRDGQRNSAILLEGLWNDLLARHEVSLLCAYAMDGFSSASDHDGFRAVCAAHAQVIPTESYASLSAADQLREISLLQQRARALEAEVEHRARLEHDLTRVLESERRAHAEAVKATKDAELARRASEQANRVKSEFLAVMSHELRTPLNAIGGYAELMELGVQGPVSEAQRELLDRIQRNQRHLLGLIDQVLNYARIETGRLRFDISDIPLSEVLATTEALIFSQMRAKGVRYESSGCDASVTVRADAEKLQQILLNVLANAVKFTERSGLISVMVECDEDRVRVNVSDTGIGIAPAKLEKIFEPFVQVDPNYTRAYEGVGLGLAVSRDLAKAMDATLEVESREGEGSTFTLTLARGKPLAPLPGGETAGH